MPSAERDARPFADDELSSLFSIFPRNGRVILAISGGADSTALLVLAQRWRVGQSNGPDLIVATVDHGLRAGSLPDAERVCALADQLGLPHELLTWNGAKPSTGIEAAAREARYGLLLRFAQKIGAIAVSLAHTLDDQAETVLMRLAAGSGPAGLASMRARETRGTVELLRPLLGVRKARLAATLRNAGIDWSDDLTNVDSRFARGRLRNAAAVLAREGLTPERLARLAARMARTEEVVAGAVEAARDLMRHPDRPARLGGWALVGAAEEIALRVLAAEITAVSGADKPRRLRLHRLEAVWDALQFAIVAGRPFRRTIGGALVSVDPKDRSVLIVRAPARRRPASAHKETSPRRSVGTPRLRETT